MHDINIIERVKSLSNKLKRHTAPISWPDKRGVLKLSEDAERLLKNPIFQQGTRVLREECRNEMRTAGTGRWERFRGQSDKARLEAQMKAELAERFEEIFHEILLVAGDIEAELPEGEQQ